MDPTRSGNLKAMLEERLKETQRGVSGRVREIRTTSYRQIADGPTDVDRGSLDDETELALLQLNADLATKIKGALRRLETGDYGRCQECGQDISAARLRALPFAARCKPCQEGVDAIERHERRLEQHALGSLLSRLTERTERSGW